jgi:hypothetical protein
MEKFELNEKQIEYLKKEYPDNDLVQKVLATQKGVTFEIDLDTYLEFMDYIEDESVYWMDANHEASPKTYMLESIRDDIFYQTN